jgi:hypothetical protein
MKDIMSTNFVQNLMSGLRYNKYMVAQGTNHGSSRHKMHFLRTRLAWIFHISKILKRISVRKGLNHTLYTFHEVSRTVNIFIVNSSWGTRIYLFIFLKTVIWINMYRFEFHKQNSGSAKEQAWLIPTIKIIISDFIMWHICGKTLYKTSECFQNYCHKTRLLASHWLILHRFSQNLDTCCMLVSCSTLKVVVIHPSKHWFTQSTINIPEYDNTQKEPLLCFLE